MQAGVLPGKEINSPDEVAARPRKGNKIGTWEVGMNIGIFSFKITGIRCDGQDDVICVAKEGVATHTTLKDGNGNTITTGHFSHEEVIGNADGTTDYLFYFYDED